MKPAHAVLVFVFMLFAVTACAVPGSYVTTRAPGMEKTYRYNDEGKKVLVYEEDKYGTLFVYDENDQRAKMKMAGRKWVRGGEQSIISTGKKN